eukprot:4810010-Alexandrium_andersonii.AAC.1
MSKLETVQQLSQLGSLTDAAPTAHARRSEQRFLEDLARPKEYFPALLRPDGLFAKPGGEA